jgi:hypothetical protein
VRYDRIKLLRFVEPQPQRKIGLVWRPTSPRKADFLELGQILLRTLKCDQSLKAQLTLATDVALAANKELIHRRSSASNSKNT